MPPELTSQPPASPTRVGNHEARCDVPSVAGRIGHPDLVRISAGGVRVRRSEIHVVEVEDRKMAVAVNIERRTDGIEGRNIESTQERVPHLAIAKRRPGDIKWEQSIGYDRTGRKVR